MSDNYFEGYYFKHQKDGQTVAFIPGKAKGTAFIQVITNEKSYNFDFPEIHIGKEISVGGCKFGTGGISINLPDIRGDIRYEGITPIRYNIMGPFKYFPMECRHGVISMRHSLRGSINIGGEVVNFTGGTGYIEKDSGRSFPKEYIWIQCNDLPENGSIMLSLAHIPFMGFSFQGCICVIIYNSREYRLATYLGVKIEQAGKNRIVLNQRKYCLTIDIEDSIAHVLRAPKNGLMTGSIHESNSAKARFRFSIDGSLLFDMSSEHASSEIHLN